MTEDEITKYRQFLANHFDLRLYTEPTTGRMYCAEYPVAADLYNSLAALQNNMVFKRKWYEAYSKKQIEDFERDRGYE
jgi:hypothetical protein